MTTKYKALLLAGVLATLGGNAFADTTDTTITDSQVTITSVSRTDGHTTTYAGGGTVSITTDSDAFASRNGSTINFGTADKKLTSLTIKNNNSGIVDGKKSTTNICAGKFEQNCNGYGLGVYNGGTLNVNVDEFVSSTKFRGIEVLSGEGQSSHVVINAKKVDITAETEPALWVQNNTQDATAPKGATSLDITADTITIKSNSKEGIDAYSNSQINISGNTTITATNAIDTRGNSTVNINVDGKHSTVVNGDVVFETPNTPQDAKNSGNLINSYVNLNLTGKDSKWDGRAYQQYTVNGKDVQNVELNAEPYYGNVTGFGLTIADGATWNMTGDSFVNNAAVSNDGAINMNGNATFNAGKITLNEGIIDLNGADNTVNIGTLNGNGTVTTNTLDNTVSISNKDEKANVTVKGSSEITDLIASGKASLQDLADVVTDEGKGGDNDDYSAADSVVTDANDINGGYSADVSDGKVNTGTVVTHENTTNRAVSDMASISLMTWRQENNDMNKRLGELRDSKGEHGAWVRMARGQSKYGAQHVKNQYNYYQVGYDQKLGASDWTLGVAISRTEGKSSFTTGSGENNHTGFAIYGSHLSDNGSFIDVIAKYARMDHDYVTTGAGVGNADYDTNGYSFSAEYGKRFTKDSGLWIEPQVELTYGKVTSADYTTSKGAKVHQDSMDSFVSRFGFALGQNFKRGNAYVRASYLYDFEGKTDVTMSKEGAGSYSFHQDLGGGWWEVGIGTNINFSDTTHLYFDVEKTYGGTVATPWQWNLGVRFSF